MTLTPEQRATVADWITAGAGLSEIQKRLKEELSVSLTYLDTRFLIDDLKLTLRDPEPDTKPVPPAPSDSAATAFQPEPPQPDDGEGFPPARVSVTIDQITRPSALVSGKTTFSDGQTAEWSLDQMGRLALNPSTPGYRPKKEDVIAFQTELQRLASSQGF